jgi:hypothetical protein
MIEGTRTHIMGRAALLAALGMATAQVWLGLAPAQAASTSPAAVVAEQRLDAGGEAEGRVSEVTAPPWCGLPTAHVSRCPPRRCEEPSPSVGAPRFRRNIVRPGATRW